LGGTVRDFKLLSGALFKNGAAQKTGDINLQVIGDVLVLARTKINLRLLDREIRKTSEKAIMTFKDLGEPKRMKWILFSR